ncbi:TATA box-binding protein-associated factor RNA polymerase I subunit B-like [Babylonia areolata]|uniref:TATA box-binding protein-associated factor RNA polymerase I subunit B-like n=1 Tax=Babylonia areolata TaxID=304850 RepID=UPI003FD56B34
MPVCDVCGEDEYYEEDGYFFCTVCNTQSQSMVVMEFDDTHLQRSSVCLREVQREKRSREGRSEYEAGRPWTRYEAYQLILQAQADALITRGAHHTVKETVLRLYFAYLSKLRVAFVADSKTCLIPKGLEKADFAGWHRELHRGGMENPAVNPKVMKRKVSKHQGGSAAKLKEKESLCAALEGETFYEGDNPLENNDDDDEEEDPVSDLLLPLPADSESDEGSDEEAEEVEGNGTQRRKRKHSSSEPKSLRFGKDAVLNNVRYMNLRRTLSFLYAACLFVSPWVTVSDILRWVSCGTLPYMEATHLLHSDMKMSAYDHHLFRTAKVTAESLRLDTGILLRFLDVEQVPAFLVKDITIRYTLSLDLPKSFVPSVVRVVRQCPVKCSPFLEKDAYCCKSVPNVDALSAAYILVALKAMFGLDDHRERLLSEYTKEVQKKVDVLLFDWLKWQWHASHKFLIRPCRVPTAPGQEGREEEEEVEALCQTFSSAQYKDQRYSHLKLYNRNKKSRRAHFKQENREMLKRPISVLEERWKNREAVAARIRAEEDTRAPSGNSEAVSKKEQAVQFRTSSIEHLIQAEKFLQSHLSPGEISCTSDRLTQERSPTSEDSLSTPSSPDCSLLTEGSGSGSGGERDGVRVRKKKGKADKRKSVKEDTDVVREEGGEPEAEVMKKIGRGAKRKSEREDTDVVGEEGGEPEDDITRLQAMHRRVSGDYHVSPRQVGGEAYSAGSEWWRERSTSYRWLLRVLSTLVLVPHADIQRMVCEVEQGLLHTT